MLKAISLYERVVQRPRKRARNGWEHFSARDGFSVQGHTQKIGLFAFRLFFHK
jgi:hypothetical protein